MTKQKLFFDAIPLTEDKMSGIGHVLLNLLRTLERDPNARERYELILIAPKYTLRKLERWNFQYVSYKAIPLKPRIIHMLSLLGIEVPMDIFLGKGTYIFLNYRNWPLLSSKSITYIHDLGYLHYPEFMRSSTLKLMKYSIPVWTNRTTILATGSHYTKREIIDYLKIPEDKIRVVHHGIDTSVYCPQPTEEIDRVKRKYGIKSNYILFVGNIEPRKNIRRLVQAYAQLPKQLSDEYALLLVGGNGWNNQSIIDEIAEARYQGFKIIQPSRYVIDKDLPALLSGAVTLAHPAVYEGFGLPPLQAMACGTPVLVADNSSLPEVVGDAGLYVDALNTKDIARQLEHLLSDGRLQRELAKKGLEQARKFSWDSSAKHLLELVEAVQAR